MITLGINAAFHDSAAALVIDGEVVAAAEEERFTRIKHGKRPVPFSAWELPFHAIDDCLRQAGLQMADLDHVAYSYDPWRFLAGRAAGDRISLPLQPSAQEPAGWENPWDPLFAAYIINAPRQLADGAPHHLRERFAGITAQGPYRFHFVDHHLAHQASAFLAAPFDDCAVLTLDGRGEWASTTYGVHADGHYRALGEVRVPSSLGLLYEDATRHLGFLHSSDEYKVMALAAFGQPRFASALREHVEVGGDGSYRIRPIDFTALVGPPRRRGTALEQRHFDLAASLQSVLEQTVLQLIRWLRAASGQSRLAMAGGVALNCVMNAKLRDSGVFERIWVQPAAGDAGTALGAALLVDAQSRAGGSGDAISEGKEGDAASAGSGRREYIACDGGSDGEPTSGARPLAAPRRWRMQHAYLGPGYDDAEIEALLQWARLGYRRLDDVAGATARLLAEDRVIGWFQGRMEFGPRALGARSIIASPIDARMQMRINELKDREDFRPVAPAVPEERFADWFMPADHGDGSAAFMLFVYEVRPEQAQRIAAACHRDRSARVQAVSRAANPQFHALLEAFGRLTGVPVLINTSFNVRGEPIVCTPKDALDAFHSTPLDALVIGSFLLEKAR